MYNRVLIEERDACAIISFINKNGKSSHANVVKTIEALKKMGHRSGDIDGEGDGTGITIDIPRKTWAKKLENKGLKAEIVNSSEFLIGHIYIPEPSKAHKTEIVAKLKEILKNNLIDVLFDLNDNFRENELGMRAKMEIPVFWQFCAVNKNPENINLSKKLYDIKISIEKEFPDIHVASLSQFVSVYKVRGGPEILTKVFPDLEDENTTSSITLGHTRYSTNTLPTIERAQPFSILGHNGEINTIERIRTSGEMMGIRMVPGGSDSQDLDRIIEGLINLYNLHPIEAIEIVFPVINTEVLHYPKELQDLYNHYRWFFPSSAQGPAAIIGRYGDVCLGSVDALGLRPLWLGESDYDYFLSSEKGVVPLSENMTDPRPLAPGEKIAIFASHNKRARVLNHGDMQKELLAFMQNRQSSPSVIKSLKKIKDLKNEKKYDFTPVKVNNNILRAFGWQKFDHDLLKRMVKEGKDIVGSMGHQGPLAVISQEGLPNLPDFFKENVAVVTNPAIDREREAEHFSAHVILGDKPEIKEEHDSSPVGLWLENPLIMGGFDMETSEREWTKKIAGDFGTCLLDDIYEYFTENGSKPDKIKIIDSSYNINKSFQERLDEIGKEVLESVRQGSNIIVIDDKKSFSNSRAYLDPSLVVPYINNVLIDALLRRKCSIIVSSAAIRNLHDIMFLLGMGADALNPYLLWQIAKSFAEEDLTPETALKHIMTILQQGIEKIMSTMGIHELCGYGRIFGSVGLKEELAKIFKAPNFCSSVETGFGFVELENLSKKRYETANSSEELSLYSEEKRNPKAGKIIRDFAKKTIDVEAFTDKMKKLDEEHPIGIRHLISIKNDLDAVKLKPEDVDISVGDHDMPVVIAAMSFGSQGENSFRTYAEAAKKANIVCMNGEGGEIPDMLNKFNKNRGQQIASGRFGVYMGLLNSGDFLEIKIGQGAKPGEGGHLPGAKVSEMVAKARHCKPGIPLISPSNQHDIYSIEDLAQIVTELKTANPKAKVSVKIPVTMGCGTIAVGIAKAGADIVNLSGFEGGTGAAREHAKKFVGFPIEIGVTEAHKALVASGIRDKIEVWCDGGLRNPYDIVKMILLGANRIGMGTLALMSIGCISCERCHLDKCPRGISTQLRTKEDAENKGVKGFSPRVVEQETASLASVLKGLGEGIRNIVANMGEPNLQKLVGRTDLLEQARFNDTVDLKEILEPATCYLNCMKTDEITKVKVRKPLNLLTKVISDMAIARFKKGDTFIDYIDQAVQSNDRAIGTYLSGEIVRNFGMNSIYKVCLNLEGSVPGNGLCAFNIPNVDAIIDGGAQDGFAKGSIGGSAAVLKGSNCLGVRIDGSVGKSFAYGAISGSLIVQNFADSRACIRMSGADVVFGARIKEKVRDEEGNIASRAHIKGFAFEYMTGGRAIVLCDPGPWMCAGMTGGVIYQCLYPEFNFTKDSIKRRLSKGANVTISSVDEKGISDINELLLNYIDILKKTYQYDEAMEVESILSNLKERFVMIEPKGLRQVKAA